MRAPQRGVRRRCALRICNKHASTRRARRTSSNIIDSRRINSNRETGRRGDAHCRSCRRWDSSGHPVADDALARARASTGGHSAGEERAEASCESPAPPIMCAQCRLPIQNCAGMQNVPGCGVAHKCMRGCPFARPTTRVSMRVGMYVEIQSGGPGHLRARNTDTHASTSTRMERFETLCAGGRDWYAGPNHARPCAHDTGEAVRRVRPDMPVRAMPLGLCRPCGSCEPSRSADVARVSPVPVQLRRG